MNYLKIYNQICERAKIQLEERIYNRKNKLEYYESHHITPKCMGGDGTTQQWRHNNIVILTAKEHYLCHLLLHYMYPDNKKLIFALHKMLFSKCSNNKKEMFYSSRVYDYFRKVHSESIRGSGNPMFGKNHSEDTIKKLKDKKKGISNPHVKGDKNPSKRPEVAKKISESKLGDKNPMKRLDVRKKMANTLKATNERRRQLGLPRYNKLTCPYCNTSGSSNNMTRYHFNNCKYIKK
jgi:hypothetical protein